MTRSARWWEAGERTLEAEEAWYATSGLEFTLDRALLEKAGVVVYRGELRFHDERFAATVVYPPAYAAGEQPAVYAPDMPIERHKRHDGLLCLDHTVFGERAPMTGAEAVERAEELWALSIENPDALRAQEADAPEPRADAYYFEEGSIAFLFDVDVSEHDSGVVRLGASHAQPFRASLLGVAVDAPEHTELRVADENVLFRGDASVCGLWQRVDAPPPGPQATTVAAWAREHHGDLMDCALRFARAHRQVTRTTVPALVGFVFRDEGPKKDEWHDAWLLLVISPNGTPKLTRVASIDQDDQWTRQPQLASLGTRRVGVVGVGALGSQVAALLARAGVGEFYFVDPDVVTPGILVRHQLSHTDVGLPKVSAMQRAVGRINPYAASRGAVWRYGDVRAGGDPGAMQQLNDTVTDELIRCDLIIDASVHTATEYFLSAVGDLHRTPVLHLAVSSGAWGARLLLQRPGRSGCLECLARHQEDPRDDSPAIPPWAEDPRHPEILERGCAQATFAGPGFELTDAAAAAARCAVQILLDGEGYPSADFDLATLTFRTETESRPAAEYSALPRHPACGSCRG
jgi:molybdopterin/thiamine biosynthesis adenylyltransferase